MHDNVTEVMFYRCLYYTFEKASKKKKQKKKERKKENKASSGTVGLV